ncbi:lantibiotic dehydratase family protein [Nocardiopsis sp. LOL_012]|uniref:lantibiotic dehydratase family protein n=1 Tax=Nocardiopsis sp. LOL_012 TaxID=3345409 RepID=UPI003A89CE03
MTRSRPSLYRGAGGGMLRAAANLTGPDMAPWPGPDARIDDWRAWLGTVWADATFRQAVSATSPDLARQVESILEGHAPKPRRVRRAALATARYALRYTRRSTPFGWFAGVAPLEFGDTVHIRVGNRHRAVTRPDPVALDTAISDWESGGTRMADVEVCVNNLAYQRDGRVHVPSEGDAQYSVALTPALDLVLDAARSPIRFSVLAGKLAAEFPGTAEHHPAGLLSRLLRVRLLLSSLRAPATVADPADPLPVALCQQAQARPAAPDLRLDATIRLPRTVVTEAETAAAVLTRLTPYPQGTAAWQHYADRFADRYGEGTEVPLPEVTDPAKGLGMPEGFTQASSPPRPMVLRDRLLLDLAGTAAVEGRRAVTLSGATIERLEAAAGTPALTPPHLEVCAQVQATSAHALETGNFWLRISTVSRAAGSMTGRFWHLLPHTAQTHTRLPTVDPGVETAQLSFHPARAPADPLTRAPQILPRLVSVGEFRRRASGVLFPSDLAVGIREGRLYLCEAATGQRLELLAPTAINFVWNHYTPPLVRFLAEISRARTPQVTGFEWGAAWTLPFTPALRYRRSVLAPARWKVQARDLPGRAAALDEWAEKFHAWRSRFGVPERVLLAQDDQQLPLDLDQEMHLDLVRAHLSARPNGVALLHDAPPPNANGWIGGRAHSIVVPLEARP